MTAALLTLFDDTLLNASPPGETEILFDDYETMLFDDGSYVIES